MSIQSIKDNYNNLVEDYSEIILEDLLTNSDLIFDELDASEQNDKYDLLANFSWKDFVEENTRFTISQNDLTYIRIIIPISEYFEFAIDNKYNKSKFKNLIVDIFKRECYLKAILKYTIAYSDKFQTPKFLKDTEEYLNDKSTIQTEFFTGL